MQWLGRTAGSNAAERRDAMPGDGLVGDPQIRATHAATLRAPPERLRPNEGTISALLTTWDAV